MIEITSRSVDAFGRSFDKGDRPKGLSVEEEGYLILRGHAVKVAAPAPKKRTRKHKKPTTEG